MDLFGVLNVITRESSGGEGVNAKDDIKPITVLTEKIITSLKTFTIKTEEQIEYLEKNDKEWSSIASRF